MLSNYKFRITRSPAIQSGVPPQTPVVARTPLGAYPRAPTTSVPVTNSNRFSVNRLIHIKSSGGCRSCGS